MDQLPQDWIETGLRVTGHFEDASDPLGAVTGNFDGMGVSLGVLQWNIGSNSLQPMVRAVGQPSVLHSMPTYGGQLWNACTGTITDGLQICRSWQTGNILKNDVFSELKAFTHGADFVARQIATASNVAAAAFAAAKSYATTDPSCDTVTKALFCWFFDVYTQNGGMKGVAYADVKAFIAAHGAAGADDFICDWLASLGSGSASYLDCHENAKLWRNAVPGSSLSLLVLSYLRAQLSRPEYRGNVMNRKGTIALGHGWVNREKQDVSQLLA